MGPFWRPIYLSQNTAHLPPLLVKHDFGVANYTVFVTDLTHIWTEHLDRKQILRRALNIDPSIDPSEDADQMQQFLRNVRGSLTGESGTRLSLSQGDTPKQLVLNTFTSLPVPLEPLEWPIYLHSAAQNVFTSEFVLPCLNRQLNAEAKIESLLQHLRDKDHVINRLTQKMQSDGLDFSKIFPSIAVSKTVNRLDSRKSCAKLVKGLGEFDEDNWASSFRNQSTNVVDIASGLFARGIASSADVSFEASEVGPWWDHLGDQKNLESKINPDHPNDQLVSKRTEVIPKDVVDLGKEFQRQPTPPQLKSSEVAHQGFSKIGQEKERRVRALSPTSANEGSTTDDSNGDLVPSKEYTAPQSNGFEVIDDARARRGQSHDKPAIVTKLSKGFSNSLESTKDRGNFSGNSAGDTVKHEESLPASPDAVSETLDNTHPAPKAKAKLGKIGGKKKVLDEQSQLLNHPVEDKEIPDHKSSTHAGTSADVESNTSRDPLVTDVRRTSRPNTKGESPSPRETSQERANRKRAELKRNLEDKSKSAAKKKRKF